MASEIRDINLWESGETSIKMMVDRCFFITGFSLLLYPWEAEASQGTTGRFRNNILLSGAHALLGHQQNAGAQDQDGAQDVEQGGAHAAGGGQDGSG